MARRYLIAMHLVGYVPVHRYNIEAKSAAEAKIKILKRLRIVVEGHT